VLFFHFKWRASRESVDCFSNRTNFAQNRGQKHILPQWQGMSYKRAPQHFCDRGPRL